MPAPVSRQASGLPGGATTFQPLSIAPNRPPIASRPPTAAELDALCTITAAKLRRLASSRVSAETLAGYAAALETHRRAGEINTLARVTHFVAQLAHECAHFTRMVESFAYRPARAHAMFRRYVKSVDHATQLLAADSTGEAFAEVVYGGRMDNKSPGDGYRYRGRGFIQLTGKAQYRDMSDRLVNMSVDLVADPDRAAEADIAARVAVAYWKKKGLNAHADRDDIVALTKAINGGENGLPERRQLLAVARAAFYPRP